ncbi:MAG: hypothetical protein K8S16_21470 [Bacteroidales bacterium]|nr:hypothetical protein [Bacteroidales bacterium]
MEKLIPKYVAEGYLVKLGDLGSFRLSVKSEGKEADKDISFNAIKGVKLIFTPGRDMKAKLNNIVFEKG